MSRFFYLILFLIGTLFLFSGCYKKDLEEFESIESSRLTSELAIPLFYSKLTIRDSIPFQLPNLKLADTLKVDLHLSSYMNDISVDYITAVELKLISENTFPIKSNLQLYFIDNNNTILDSLFSVVSSTTQQDKTNTTYTTTLIQLDKEKYMKIERATKVFIRYTFSTSNYPIDETNYIDLKSGLKFSLNYVKEW